jgi:hypothetical protein
MKNIRAAWDRSELDSINSESLSAEGDFRPVTNKEWPNLISALKIVLEIFFFFRNQSWH